jgi:hypothetical protein
MSSPAEYQRRWRRAHPDRVRELTRSYRERNPEAAYARNALNAAVRSGKLQRPHRCELCGRAPGKDSAGRSLIQAHHVSYKRPYDVLWVDKWCHADLHLGEAA